MTNTKLVIFAIIALLFIQEIHGQWKGQKSKLNRRKTQRDFRECEWGSVGICNRNDTCPKGSYCRHDWSRGSSGICCRINKKWCPSGIFGRSCSRLNPCQSGYTCRKRVCCRDPVCPRGWIEGDSCRTLIGQESCPEGYECINNYCCRSTFCPFGSVGPKCSSRNPCKTGYSCRGGNCCREPVCPSNWLEGGVCNLTPGEPFCKNGFECNNDFCCKRPDPIICASDEESHPCLTSEQCGFGYECMGGFCCKVNIRYRK